MENNIELVYSSVKTYRRIFADLIDAFLVGFTTFLLFSLSNMIVVNMPFYSEMKRSREAVQNESGLYVEGYNMAEYYTNDDAHSYSEKKTILATAIDSFYSNPYFFNSNEAKSLYNVRKTVASNNGLSLFISVEGNLQEADVSPESLFTFYKTEISEQCIGYVIKSGTYVETSKTIFLTAAIQVLIYLTVSVFLYFGLFPTLIFKRGRQTIGRKVFKIALLGKDALVVGPWQSVLRCAFIYFVYFWLGFLGFLIPEIISVTMLVMSKRSQNLVDYVLNQYEVDCRDDDVFMDYGDYEAANESRQAATLENKNLEAKL